MFEAETTPALATRAKALRGDLIVCEDMGDPTLETDDALPYKNYRFRVKWDGLYVAGVSRVSPLVRTVEVVEFREGGDAGTTLKTPGHTRYQPVTLERGVSQDKRFEEWANLALKPGAAPDVPPKDFRKDIVIEFYNEAGQLALAYKIFRCWVSEYQALPTLDADANAIAIQHIKLENEGWERDASIPDPTEP